MQGGLITLGGSMYATGERSRILPPAKAVRPVGSASTRRRRCDRAGCPRADSTCPSRAIAYRWRHSPLQFTIQGVKDMNVQQFLKQRDVPFDTLDHRPTYDAQSLAQAVHVSGDEVAKTVLLKRDSDFTLAVLPATHKVDCAMLRQVLGAKEVRLATEDECAERFGDCELGALPPFGSQYGLKTIVDRSLLGDEEIVFEGNTHHEAIRMKLADFEALEQPAVAEFSHHV